MYGYMSKPRIDRKVQVPTGALWSLLTPSEIRMLKNRWQIVNLLQNGLSIRSIAKQIKVGTDTVVRVARIAKKGDFKKITPSQKLPFKTNTPWIFGKSND